MQLFYLVIHERFRQTLAQAGRHHTFGYGGRYLVLMDSSIDSEVRGCRLESRRPQLPARLCYHQLEY